MLVAEPAQRLVSSYFYRQAQALLQKQHATPNRKSGIGRSVNESTADEQILPRALPFDEADLMRYANEVFVVDRDAVQWHWLADGASPSGTLGDVLAHVLPRFNFIGLTHRFDETLVLLRRALALPPTPRALLHVRLKDSAVAPAATTTAASGTAHPKFADLQPGTQAAVRLAVERNGDVHFFAVAQERFQSAVSAANSNTQSSTSPLATTQRSPALKLLSFAIELADFQATQTSLTQRCAEVGGQQPKPSTGSSSQPRHTLRDPRLRCMLSAYDESHPDERAPFTPRVLQFSASRAKNLAYPNEKNTG